MTDNTELQRLTRIRASVARSRPACRPISISRTFQVHGHVHELAAGAPQTHNGANLEQGSASSGAGGGAGELPGTGHTLPTGRPAFARCSDDLSLVDDDEVDEDPVAGR